MQTKPLRQRLAEAQLYVLLDARSSLDKLGEYAVALMGAGVDILQLREKGLNDRELLRRARRLREVTAGSGTLLVVNDRPDIALLAAADGVHVGQDELPVRDVRQLVGPEMLVGVSTHSIQQARQAVLDGPDYIGCGPTFPSSTKDFDNFPGTELLQQVAREIRLPAFAIGGIDRTNLPQVLAAGFARIAVSSAIHRAADPIAEARYLRAQLSGCRSEDRS